MGLLASQTLFLTSNSAKITSKYSILKYLGPYVAMVTSVPERFRLCGASPSSRRRACTDLRRSGRAIVGRLERSAQEPRPPRCAPLAGSRRWPPGRLACFRGPLLPLFICTCRQFSLGHAHRVYRKLGCSRYKGPRCCPTCG